MNVNICINSIVKVKFVSVAKEHTKGTYLLPYPFLLNYDLFCKNIKVYLFCLSTWDVYPWNYVSAINGIFPKAPSQM